MLDLADLRYAMLMNADLTGLWVVAPQGNHKAIRSGERRCRQH